MNNIIRSSSACFIALILLLFSCGEFPTSYYRIDSDKIRVLDFIYTPAEVSPGDTVALLAVFSGREVKASDIAWNISYNLKSNGFNIDAAYDIMPLENYTVKDTNFSPDTNNTNGVVLRFPVRQDAMVLSSMFPENWVSMVPAEFQKYIPAELLAMKKSDVLSLLELFKDTPIDSSIQPFIPMLMQIATIKIRLFAKVKSELSIRGDYTVRYNSHYTQVPNVYINTNPVIKKIGIYKVKGENLMSFDPATSPQSSEFLRLFGADDDTASDTVVIDKGYSYFVAGESDRFDRVFNILSSDSKDTVETHFYNWFFRLNDNETADVDPYKFMNIVPMTGNSIELLSPAKDGRVVSFIVWLQVYDNYLAERFRPDGSNLKEVAGVFRYTKAYLDYVKKSNK